MSNPQPAPQSPPAPGSEVARSARGRTRRAGLRDGEQLAIELERVLGAGGAEQSYDTVVAILEAGCERGLQPDQLDRIVTRLRAWPACARLTADLSLRACARRPGAAVRAVGARLRAEYERLLDYPVRAPGNGRADQHEEREPRLDAWVDGLSARRRDMSGKGRAADSPITDEEFAAIACLADEPRLPSGALYKLLDAMAGPRKLGRADDTGLLPDSVAFLRQLRRDLFENRGVRGRLRKRLDWAGPARRLAASNAEQCRAVNEQRAQEEAGHARLRERYRDAEAARQVSERRIVDLEQELSAAREMAAMAEQRLREREEHWRITSGNQLARALSDVRERLAHEVDQAYVALEATTPYVDIARRRLQTARGILADLAEGRR